MAQSTGLQAIKAVGLVEAARDAQEKLRRMGLAMDDRAMPGRELDVARVGARSLRKRQTSWKQPLTEAAIRCEPFKSLAARLAQMGGDENARWLTANEGPKCTPLNDLEFRGARRILPTSKTALTRWHSRGQVLGPPGRTRAKLHDVGCHIIHNACCNGK